VPVAARWHFEGGACWTTLGADLRVHPARLVAIFRLEGSVWVRECVGVSVSVETLWRSPDLPRAVEAPALANAARIQLRLTDLRLARRRARGGRADTHPLLGERIRVVWFRAKWASAEGHHPSVSPTRKRRGCDEEGGRRCW
jgi:hypothetical protein